MYIILIKECPKYEQRGCFEPCQPTCDDRNRKPCPTKRCIMGCSCIDGYIRKYEGGPCIAKTQCPFSKKLCKS